MLNNASLVNATITLPSSPDSERAVLGSIILAPGECLWACHELGLQPEAFYVPAHRIVYEALTVLGEKARDFVSLKRYLEDQGKLEEVGGVQFLNEVYGFSLTPRNIVSYIDDVLHQFGRREHWIIGSEMQKQALDGKTANAYYRFVAQGFMMRQFSEERCAHLMMRRLKQTIKCVGQQWFAYSEGVWRPKPRELFLPKAITTMHPDIQTAKRAQQILDHVEAITQVNGDSLFGICKFDGDHVLINAQNGVVRVSKLGRTLEEHSPHHGFTQVMSVPFDETADYKLFESTIAECLPDPDDRVLLQLAAGNFLLPSSRYEVCLCSYGPGGTGKSTIAEAVESVFEEGSDSVSHLSLRNLCDQKGYSLPKLRWAALNIGTELDSLDYEDSSILKILVSGESLQARPIYSPPFMMRTTAKMWFLANGLPRFKNGTDAEQRRMRFLAFTQKPAAKNINLKAELKAEKTGIFLWMIDGLIELLNRNEIPQGGAQTKSVTESFATGNDPVGTFVQDRCRLEGAVPKDDLLNAFREFLIDHHLPEEKLANHLFFKKLNERFPQLEVVRAGSDGARVRCIVGISLRETH